MNGKYYWAILLLACLSNAGASQITFNDGQVHNIDYDTDVDVVHVYDSASNGATTINIMDGGVLRDFYTWDHTNVFMSEGQISTYFAARDNSIVEISGGWIQDFGVNDISPTKQSMLL